MSAIVIVPTYNERENLPLLASALLGLQPQLHLLVIDDASPDGTGVLADALARHSSRITVMHRKGKLGLGTAYVAGFQHALAHSFDRVVQMDADLSHHPDDLQRLLDASVDADVVIGSRNVPGGSAPGWSVLRRLLSRGGSVYARALLDLPIQDCTSGFKCFRREALEALELDTLRSNGFAFQLEVNNACARAGLRFAEVPITFRDRTYGESKMSLRIVIEALGVVAQLRTAGQQVPLGPVGSAPDAPIGLRPVNLVPDTEVLSMPRVTTAHRELNRAA